MKNLLLLLVFTCFSLSLGAAVKLPRIFGDNMVLQRDKPLKVWGWAAPGETVKVQFNNQQMATKASKGGMWLVTFKPMMHGGPFQMIVSGKSNQLSYNNVLIGDVWLGSGQSNMEWIMKNTNDAEKEISAANYPMIRLFTVERTISFTPESDVAGGPWLTCTPDNLQAFSAVAYYFGRKLHDELNVPIGLINSSWGGTKIEPWISWDLMVKEPAYKNQNAEMVKTSADENKINQQRYALALQNDRGISERWFDPQPLATGWKAISLPQEWSETEIGNTDGIVWFKKEFTLKDDQLDDSFTLSLGPIDDIDVTYLNGIEVGSESVYNKDRVYTIKPDVLKAGKNVIVVKVIDNQGGGGLYGRPEQLFIENSKAWKLDLSGAWEYKPSVLTSDFGIKNVGPNDYASVLYNGMIAPIIQYPVRGVIWYQGESNTNAAYEYRRLFPMLINDWRAKWGYEFSFFWVQLANFMAPAAQPSESAWAELREAQSMTLSLPKTGQAVIIDIGEADDIHPRNKRDVGLRLALNALRVAYGKELVYNGPVYGGMRVEQHKVIIQFKNSEHGLQAHGDRYGYLRGFAIAGEDKKFRWAKAHVSGNEVIVYHDKIDNPVAVRYAWGDNPDDGNLFNSFGLPASPFRTDNWKGVTQKQP